MDQDVIVALLAHFDKGSKFRAVRPLPGSFSNAVYLVEYETAVGNTNHLVIRRYAEFGDYDRGEKARREYKTLELLAAHGIPAPAPLFLDMTDEYLGSPGIVTSFVAGRQVIAPVDVNEWIQELARTLAQIHAVPLTAVEREFLLDANSEVIWFLNSGLVPDYMQQHPDGETIWQAVYDLRSQMRPVIPGLVHVDYWTGNILWAEGRVTAVLDWEEAAYGDSGYDVAYLRAELSLLGGAKLADQFLTAYVAETGRPVENLALWELAAAVRFIENPASMIPEWQTFAPLICTPASVNQNFNEFVASAKRRVGR